jgi:hypothetical protein
MRRYALLASLRKPGGDGRDLTIWAVENIDGRRRAVESRNRTFPLLDVAVDV